MSVANGFSDQWRNHRQLSPNLTNAEWELLDNMVHEVYGVGLRVLFIDFQSSHSCSIINCGVLKAAHLFSLFTFESQELDVHLDVVPRNLFLIALCVDLSSASATRKSVETMVSSLRMPLRLHRLLKSKNLGRLQGRPGADLEDGLRMLRVQPAIPPFDAGAKSRNARIHRSRDKPRLRCAGRLRSRRGLCAMKGSTRTRSRVPVCDLADGSSFRSLCWTSRGRRVF